MKLINKIPLLHRIFGKKYFIISVEQGLKDDEVLIFRHRIYIKKLVEKN